VLGDCHTAREILQQPRLWRDTGRRAAEFELGPREFVVLSGLGSSHFIGRLLEEPARGIAAVSSSELMLRPERHLPEDRRGLMLSVSRSGESPEVVEAARRVRRKYPLVRHAVISCNAEGTLARENPGSSLLLHPDANDRGLAMTSSFTSMALAARLLLHPDPDLAERLASSLEERIDDLQRRARETAALKPDRVLALGGAVAQEAALKILELTDGQITTQAETFLDVRHGPLCFVGPGTVALAFLSSDRPYEEDLLKQLSCPIVRLDSGDPLTDVVFAQMLGLLLSIDRGLDPDAPSSRGIISRVVRGVTIHPEPPRNPVAEELSRRGGPTLPLRDFQPVSMLRTPRTEVARARYPAIDIHTHIDGEDPARLRRIMDECDIERMVNLSSAVGDEARRAVDRFARDRFGVMVTVDWTRLGEPDFAEREARRLEDLFARGACGLKIFKELGLTVRMAPDDPRLDPIWDAARGRPVAIHIGDPAAFFQPVDRFNERFEELAAHPDWSFQGSWETFLETRDRLFDRRRDVRWLSVHVGGAAEDLQNVSRMLDRFPHVRVDLAARVAELGRQPYRAREFFLRYSDRICFGTDLAPHRETYRAYFRFLETRDEYFDYPTHASGQGRWKIYGLDLPDEILRRVYRENALDLLGRQ
jgi:fructoselysine-6-P-deglycase FrlB-like protein/predicted TIM-barrel fold metal-dependent hydrolase